MYHEFVFGPVPSRRLGLSLGVNMVPYKVCTFNCVYCELGRTTELTVERRSYYDVKEIELEFSRYIQNVKKLDYVTFSGSGEPTLNADLGKMIDFVKSNYDYRVAVLTNGSLLFREDVRKDLMGADVVIPSLDAAREEAFKRVNMPHKSISLNRMIEGMADFVSMFGGEVWVEVLFVKEINDSYEDVKALSEALRMIKPDKVQLGTVDRPPSYATAKRIDGVRMIEILDVLSGELSGIPVELIGLFSGDEGNFGGELERSIMKLINIRPCSEDELSAVFGVGPEDIHSMIEGLIRSGKIERGIFSGKEFIVPVRH